MPEATLRQNPPPYDLLIVGSGLFGATFCHHAVARGLRVLVIDRRRHSGGNCHSEKVAGIEVHKYGPHIFHTKDIETWNFVRKFSDFLPFTLRVRARSGGMDVPFPVNLETIRAFHPEVLDTASAERLLAGFRRAEEAGNFEDCVLGRVGERMYKALYQGYTRKQWGRDPGKLPAFIAKRIPVRVDATDRYFDDPYEGIPANGYGRLIARMLDGADLRLATDYLDDPNAFDALARTVLYTGELDRLFGYRFGRLEYRTLFFEEALLDVERHQQTALVTHCDADVPYTRTTEHAHFTGIRLPHTVVTREYPGRGGENLYPVNDAPNNARHARYVEAARAKPDFIFGGRLAEYRYFDMDHVIQSAMRKFKRYADSGFRAREEG